MALQHRLWDRCDYRDFLLKDDDGMEVVFGLKVNPYGIYVDEKGKMSGGATTLTGCLSFGATYHPVLQCRLDRFLRVAPKQIELWHSGAATVGRGAVKYADVITFVEDRQPQLIRGKQVDLGALPLRPGVNWDEMKDMVLRLARYVMLRHDFKEDVRRERKSGRGRVGRRSIVDQ